MSAEGAEQVSATILKRTCELEAIDDLGLEAAVEQKYLRLLGNAGGRLRLNVLVSHMALPRPTVEHKIEPFLIRQGLIDKDEGGRFLTETGWEHLRHDSRPAATVHTGESGGGQ